MWGATAINEFHNTDTLLYLGFPCEFPLGKGLPEGLTGVPVDLGRHLFLQHGNGCAQVFLAFNMLQQHAAIRMANLRLKNTTDVVALFSAIVNAPGFLKQLQAAKQNPDSEDSKSLLMMIVPLLNALSHTHPRLVNHLLLILWPVIIAWGKLFVFHHVFQ